MRPGQLRTAPVLATAVALVAGCGSGGSLSPQTYPGDAQQLVSPADVAHYGKGSPARVFLGWWLSGQYADAPAFLAAFDPLSRTRLQDDPYFDRELDYFAGTIRVAFPRIDRVERQGDGATIFTTLEYRQPVGSTRYITTTRLQAFELARKGGGWQLTDAHFFRSSVAPLLDQLRQDPRQFGRRICFIHTGGIFSLFPFRAELSRLLDGASLVQ